MAQKVKCYEDRVRELDRRDWATNPEALFSLSSWQMDVDGVEAGNEKDRTLIAGGDALYRYGKHMPLSHSSF